MVENRGIVIVDVRDVADSLIIAYEKTEASGMLQKISTVLFVGLMTLVYKGIQPPPPNVCRTSDGSPIIAQRVQLSDGRHLAYKEHDDLGKP
ncbi:hypothetical protein ACLOJK_028798 [Asimina triloba]